MKPQNARKEVFAAREQDRLTPSLLSRSGQDGMDAGLEQVTRPSASLLVEAAQEMVPEIQDEKSSLSNASNFPVKVSPTGRAWVVKNAMCNWCDSDASPTRRKRARGAEPGQQLEILLEELFAAHDLKSDGLLDEAELVELNEAVAEAHDSRDRDSDAVRRKYSNLFREKFDPEGRPVPYATFRRYMLEMLDEIDRDEEAQEMMVEQFLAEARLARTIVTGAPILKDRPRPGGVYNACLRFCPASESATEVRP